MRLAQSTAIATNDRIEARRGPQYNVLSFSNAQIKKRNKLLQQLVEMGWVVWETDDNEIYFVKHFFKKDVQKQRAFFQLMSSPMFGSGLYLIKRDRNSFHLKEVYHARRKEKVLKLSCFDFDAAPIGDGSIRLTQEEMGKDSFLSYLIENGFIQPDETKYFSASEGQRKKLAKDLPHILLHILEGEEMPGVLNE